MSGSFEQSSARIRRLQVLLGEYSDIYIYMYVHPAKLA